MSFQEVFSWIFLCYLIGVPLQGLVLFVAQIFYSLNDMRSTVKCSVSATAVNIVLNIILSKVFAASGLALEDAISPEIVYCFSKIPEYP